MAELILDMTPEEKQEYAKYDDAIISYFANSVTDPNICSFIFDTRHYANKLNKQRSPRDLACYMNNILSLAFVFSYGCLRNVMDFTPEELDKITNPNSLRVIKNMRKAFVEYPATSDLMEFILSDIQFDICAGNNNSGKSLYSTFSYMASFDMNRFTLAKCYSIIKKWKLNRDRFVMKSNEISFLFYSLLSSMRFLKEYNLIQVDNDFQFVAKEPRIVRNGEIDFNVIPVNHLLLKDKSGFHLLFSIETNFDDTDDTIPCLILQYTSISGMFNRIVTVSSVQKDTPQHICFPAPTFYEEITGVDYDDDSTEEENGNFINQVHTINYKYIKNLAVSLSDAISGEHHLLRDDLFKVFKPRYPQIFPNIPTAEYNNGFIEWSKYHIDWDSVIVMLLIEASPTKVLEILISSNPSVFPVIVRNLCQRIDDPSMPIYGKNEDQLTALVLSLIGKRLVVDESNVLPELIRNQTRYKRLYARAAASLLLDSLSYSSKNEQDLQNSKRMICIGNIGESIRLLSTLKDKSEIEDRVSYASSILGETIRHLICFYKGIVALSDIKIKFDTESINRCLSSNVIETYQEDMNNTFMNAAKTEVKRLSSYDTSSPMDTLALIDEFISFCENCNSEDPNTSHGNKLYTVLGKREILNLFDLKRFIVENAGHFRVSGHFNELLWIDFALDLLKYLKHGYFEANSTKMTEARKIQSISLNAIYPFTATFHKGEENYDGYKTVTFSLNIDLNHDGIIDRTEEIKVLTEFSYETSEVFYCFPNVLRSNKRWWIDPLLISFKEFNDLFVE